MYKWLVKCRLLFIGPYNTQRLNLRLLAVEFGCHLRKNATRYERVSCSALLRYAYVNTIQVYSFDCYVDGAAKSYFAIIYVLGMNSS